MLASQPCFYFSREQKPNVFVIVLKVFAKQEMEGVVCAFSNMMTAAERCKTEILEVNNTDTNSSDWNESTTFSIYGMLFTQLLYL